MEWPVFGDELGKEQEFVLGKPQSLCDKGRQEKHQFPLEVAKSSQEFLG